MGMMVSAEDDLELRTASLTPGLMNHQGEAANEEQTGHRYLGSLRYTQRQPLQLQLQQPQELQDLPQLPNH